MAVSASASAIDPAGSKHRQGVDSGGHSDRVAELALKAFMSMNRAVAIVGPDGKLLQPNLVFEKLFGDTELLDRVNREAGANNGKSDCRITLSDGRAFWVETIPMDGGWLVSAYDMSERSAKERIQGQPQSAAALAGLLVDLIGRSYTVEGHLIDVAANVGIVLLPNEATDCEQLLKNADLALHRAKCDGLGAYRFFERAMDERMQYRRNLEIDLRRALALGEFSLVYQPQVNLRQNKVTGFEALLRWQSPIRGAVSPFEFIPVAEETGIITSIGEWVLRTACLEAARWSGAQRVSVNVSAIQFKSPTLVATVTSALGESGLDPQRLELEVTESVMLDAGGAALAVLQNLREIGVRVALDDFGIGYSSLGYLRDFPFDRIKIDQSFVRGTANDAVGRAIVRAVASLGQSLGIATVAEGVETEEQMARVGSDGCTDVQGYLINRPMPPNQIDSFLRSRNENILRSA
jgi:predicted signal transduction protein with EAL and GGDEF domain